MNDSPILAAIRDSKQRIEAAAYLPRFDPQPIFLSPSQIRFLAARPDDARLFFATLGLSEERIGEELAAIKRFVDSPLHQPPPPLRALRDAK